MKYDLNGFQPSRVTTPGLSLRVREVHRTREERHARGVPEYVAHPHGLQSVDVRDVEAPWNAPGVAEREDRAWEPARDRRLTVAPGDRERPDLRFRLHALGVGGDRVEAQLPGGRQAVRLRVDRGPPRRRAALGEVMAEPRIRQRTGLAYPELDGADAVWIRDPGPDRGAGRARARGRSEGVRTDRPGDGQRLRGELRPDVGRWRRGGSRHRRRLFGPSRRGSRRRRSGDARHRGGR